MSALVRRVFIPVRGVIGLPMKIGLLQPVYDLTGLSLQYGFHYEAHEGKHKHYLNRIFVIFVVNYFYVLARLNGLYTHHSGYFSILWYERALGLRLGRHS